MSHLEFCGSSMSSEAYYSALCFRSFLRRYMACREERQEHLESLCRAIHSAKRRQLRALSPDKIHRLACTQVSGINDLFPLGPGPQSQRQKYVGSLEMRFSAAQSTVLARFSCYLADYPSDLSSTSHYHHEPHREPQQQQCCQDSCAL